VLQIAVFSDIHGNLAALTRVWSAIEEEGLDGGPILNAGDNVGYGDSPEACVRFLQSRPNIACVRGNYDKNVAAFPEKEEEYRRRWKRKRPEKFEALRDDSNVISDETRTWLRELPKEIRATVADRTILLTHYAPAHKEGLTPWTPESRLAELAEIACADVVVCGHTHMAFVRRANGVLFVNPGAVGRSWRRKPSYAVLTLDASRVPVAEVRSV
jgi:putative phosphoesterase